jgi:hypothetical protein
VRSEALPAPNTESASETPACRRAAPATPAKRTATYNSSHITYVHIYSEIPARCAPGPRRGHCTYTPDTWSKGVESKSSTTDLNLNEPKPLVSGPSCLKICTHTS